MIWPKPRTRRAALCFGCCAALSLLAISQQARAGTARAGVIGPGMDFDNAGKGAGTTLTLQTFAGLNFGPQNTPPNTANVALAGLTSIVPDTFHNGLLFGDTFGPNVWSTWDPIKKIIAVPKPAVLATIGSSYIPAAGFKAGANAGFNPAIPKLFANGRVVPGALPTYRAGGYAD